MPQYDDSLPLSPEERLRAVARLLAAGVLRLLDRPAQSAALAGQPAPENLDEVTRDCLELPGETVLSVQDG
ncbi:MAG: hypothetical protein ACK4RK_20180 [Gemmataceae bacterium]